MRVAVASDDRTTIASHFGRTRGFLLFDVAGEVVRAAGYRRVELREHACSCGAAERPSRHQVVLDALDGCEVVVGRGMGPHMYDDLVACGLDVLLTDVEDAREAIDLFIARSLPERAQLGCV